MTMDKDLNIISESNQNKAKVDLKEKDIEKD